jgi:predicted neuraminidase
MKYEIIFHEQICKKNPTIMCHASTVLPLPNGDVLAAWFGGTHEGENDVAVWVSRREDGEWTSPASIAHVGQPHWNPVLQLLPDGRVRLYYKVGAVIADWRTMVCHSADGGKTWTVPRELVAGDCSGGRGPVRSKVITLDTGRMLAPCSTERGEWMAYADISDDGESWHRTAPIRIPDLTVDSSRTVEHSDIAVSEQSFYGRGVIQPTLWQSAPGKVHMLLRSTEGHIYRSDSSDNGDTWCGAYATALPNNNSGIDLDRLPNGRLVLACNPVASNWGARSPMRLLVSEDNGISWSTLLDLDSGEGEFAYPAVVAQGNTLHVTYTWKRQNIAYWRIEIS